MRKGKELIYKKGNTDNEKIKSSTNIQAKNRLKNIKRKEKAPHCTKILVNS